MNDIYQTITDKIIVELEAGTVPWVRPWSGEADPFPRNALSQRPYRGINLSCWAWKPTVTAMPRISG